MFEDASRHAFVGALEAQWRTVRAEFDRLTATEFMPWPEKMLYDAGWDVFGLHAFGRKLPGNCARCPETARLVEAIPGMTTAGFSLLAPGAHIKPHRGYTQTVLRCHLAIMVPGRCALRVGAETREWEEGRCLVFDDTLEHEAWNHSDGPRAVLLIDFLRERERAPPEIPASVRDAVERLS
ncbi:MAG: aspartyl/asparaginyl beta-hydroxylase domain-containing protein [Ectothiorhodospiraceae bacterium]|nr:aspartyl/asparaginyl beta-hydroxylase domain-containing protein [Chromatiales bacterium]MCP5157282.1 aspartyl/asparaginyl beta-hydroxylase domain-containing protein [Ectothiorhodospiraceae bacterium]